MVLQTIDIIIAVCFCIGVVTFWLALCNMVYFAYCRNSCEKNRSEYYVDKTQVIFYVTKEASETSESHQEGLTDSIVSLLNDQYGVKINMT